MNRLAFYILLIVPSFLVGILIAYLDERFGDKYFHSIINIWIIGYIPGLVIFRMRKLGFTFREMFKSIIPFWGTQQRHRIWFDK